MKINIKTWSHVCPSRVLPATANTRSPWWVYHPTAASRRPGTVRTLDNTLPTGYKIVIIMQFIANIELSEKLDHRYSFNNIFKRQVSCLHTLALHDQVNTFYPKALSDLQAHNKFFLLLLNAASNVTIRYKTKF